MSIRIHLDLDGIKLKRASCKVVVIMLPRLPNGF